MTRTEAVLKEESTKETHIYDRYDETKEVDLMAVEKATAEAEAEAVLK